MFNLLNKEFSVDIEAPTLECGLNGHLKFLEMPADGKFLLFISMLILPHTNF